MLYLKAQSIILCSVSEQTPHLKSQISFKDNRNGKMSTHSIRFRHELKTTAKGLIIHCGLKKLSFKDDCFHGIKVMESRTNK